MGSEFQLGTLTRGLVSFQSVVAVGVLFEVGPQFWENDFVSPQAEKAIVRDLVGVWQERVVHGYTSGSSKYFRHKSRDLPALRC